jgi:hypothetical protein
MFEFLLYATLALCVGSTLLAYIKYQDVFHPLMYVPGMCLFIYVYMPIKFIKTGELSMYLTDEQCVFVQTVVVLSLSAWFIGCFIGSETKPLKGKRRIGSPSQRVLHKGAYVLGGLGLMFWYLTVQASGGLTRAFGSGNGMVWSPYGWVRESVYLLIVAVLLLLSPEGFKFPNKIWLLSIAAFSTPWLIQGLFGARRGPTFIITVAIGMSWYIARGSRPSPFFLLVASICLGMFMLFLVANRQKIYIGSSFENLDLNVTDKATEMNEANEYIFGGGTMIATRTTGKYYYGKRYLTEIFIRPIPRAIWPNKYADMGMAELEQNAGVAGEGIKSVTNWEEVPGSAAAMVADFWVEFGWLSIPFCGLVGWGYGYVWKRAVTDGLQWNTLYVTLAMLSIFMVTQSGEAVIFRLLLLTIPCYLIWLRAIAVGEQEARRSGSLVGSGLVAQNV